MTKTEYPPRRCLAPGCRKQHTRRGDFCSDLCRVRNWRLEHREEVFDDGPIEDVAMTNDYFGNQRICHHLNCTEPISYRRRYCCDACKQDAYRIRNRETLTLEK